MRALRRSEDFEKKKLREQKEYQVLLEGGLYE